MRIAVLGTGNAGRTLATKLVEIEHHVVMGARDAGNETARAWAAQTGGSHADFAGATSTAELVVNATAGTASLDALAAAGADHLAGKTLLDVANPLDFSNGFPPGFSVGTDESLAEKIQAAFPDTRVVKGLNTVTADLMVQPSLVPGRHHLFICGNDDAAKSEVATLLKELGWASESIIDLGDLSAARGTELYLALWIRLMQTQGSPLFNIAVMPGG